MAKRKKSLLVGKSKIVMRTIGGKRRKVRVTKKSKGKYSVKLVGAKKRKKR